MPPWIMCDDADDAPDDEVVALDEHDVDALQREVAEGRDAVDAAADDDDVGRRAGAERRDIRARAVGCGAVLGSLRGRGVRRHRCPLDAVRPARGRLAPAGRVWMNTS